MDQRVIYIYIYISVVYIVWVFYSVCLSVFSLYLSLPFISTSLLLSDPLSLSHTHTHTHTHTLTCSRAPPLSRVYVISYIDWHLGLQKPRTFCFTTILCLSMYNADKWNTKYVQTKIMFAGSSDLNYPIMSADVSVFAIYTSLAHVLTHT